MPNIHLYITLWTKQLKYSSFNWERPSFRSTFRRDILSCLEGQDTKQCVSCVQQLISNIKPGQNVITFSKVEQMHRIIEQGNNVEK